jgi:integrase
MGRTPTKNLTLPPGMRKRVRGDKSYYFYDAGGKPRKEISLGTDFITALRKYADLHQVDAPRREIIFADVVAKYRAEAMPKLSANTIRIQQSDIKHVDAYFKDAPLVEIKPMHIARFLEKHKDKPTTANRCKRLFSTMWNKARGWGYTDLPNPCVGVETHTLKKRTVYITDDVLEAVHKCASAPLSDALDLAYLTGQRPGDALSMTEHDIIDGHLIVTQIKTKQPLRIQISGALAALIERIRERKRGYKIVTAALLVNLSGKRLTKAVLRNHFEDARDKAAAEHPELAEQIKKFWFYDLRAKAADDTSDERGEQAASDLLGHDSVRTTQKHYLRRGKIVAPTK